MLIEVETHEKPALRGRAILSSSLLLVGAITLASTIAWQRSGDRLSSRIAPEGWLMSFRPPRRFRALQPSTAETAPAYVFSGPTRDGTSAILAVYRLTGPFPGGALAVCERVLGPPAWPTVLTANVRSTPEPVRRRLGSREAIELRNAQLGMVVRAVVLNDEEAYAIALGVNAVGIGAGPYHLFTMTCDSVEFR